MRTDYLKAKDIFIEIESRSPGLYATAANLGTAYELLGNNDSAYYWIGRAVKINPTSHEGSEWIHLKILEAKIKSKGNNKYFLTHSILGLNFGDKDIPENKTGMDAYELSKQLNYQLSERMSFVKPPDILVGQLLFDAGNAGAIAHYAVTGLEIYEQAEAYGFTSPLLQERKAKMASLQKKADSKTKFKEWLSGHELIHLFGILAISAFAIVLFVLVLRFLKHIKA